MYSNYRRAPYRRNRYAPRGGSNKDVVQRYIARATAVKPQLVQPAAVADVPYSSLMLNEKLHENIARHGYTHMTPIQTQAIPAILNGKDVTGIANTGTGKTAAFLIPIIEQILQKKGKRALIITPTRELALQIRDEMQKFTMNMPIYSAFCIGKSSMRDQIYNLRRNPDVVIGTPGRLKDFIERKHLRPGEFNTIVLDEADRMLDMGFVQDIRSIISLLPKNRQSLFFSATVSPAIAQLISAFTVSPVTISVKINETTADIHQEVVTVEMGKKKVDTLHQLLLKEEFKKVLVFGATKHGVEELSRELFKRGHKVTSIHGDKAQFQRQQAIRMFKEDAVRVLVATDVAARGLDINNVSHVVNFDVPKTYEDYIHRIGRTGRANKTGVALTLV